MIITRSSIQWNLTYEGEPMQSPIFGSYEECVGYIQRSPVEQRDSYTIISRIRVEQISDWAEWK